MSRSIEVCCDKFKFLPAQEEQTFIGVVFPFEHSNISYVVQIMLIMYFPTNRKKLLFTQTGIIKGVCARARVCVCTRADTGECA